MWVYWLSLVFLSIVLFFPYNKIFSTPMAIRASAATFVIGLIYPLLQAKLSVGQTFFSLALLLLFLGMTISRHHPNWQEEEPEETEQNNLSPEPTGTELAAVKVASLEAYGTEESIKAGELFDANPDILNSSHRATGVLSQQATAREEAPQEEMGNKEPTEADQTAQPEAFSSEESVQEVSQGSGPCVRETREELTEVAEMVVEENTAMEENTPAEDAAGSTLLQDDIDSPNIMKPDAEEPGTTEVDLWAENPHAADLDTPALSEDVPEALECSDPVSQQPDKTEASIWDDNLTAATLETSELSEDVPEPLENSVPVSPQPDITEEILWEDNLTTAATMEEQTLWEDAPEIVGASDTVSGDTTTDVDQAYSLPAESLPETASVPADDGSPQSLLVEGLRLAKLKQYAPAVRHFNKVIATDPEPELLYVAISELSSLYQHLGLYPMAAAIINAFAKHPVLKEHPGMDNLIQKAKFIQCLIDLLNRDRYGHIPYEQVPEAVRREAFHNSLTIKHFIS